MARRGLAPAALGVLAGCVLAFSLVVAPAQAFTVQGGTTVQRAYVTEVIQACALAPSSTDAELRAFGPVKVKILDMGSVRAYSKMGCIYLDDDLLGELLAELTAHEWAHQIWYSLGPKWWDKWTSICDPGGNARADQWRKDPAENFAECVRLTLWGSQYSLRDYACTDLVVIDPPAVREWLSVARYANKCPFDDLAPTAMATTGAEDELAAAGGYLYTEGIVLGYPDGTFGAYATLAKRHLAAICERAGLPCPYYWRFDPTPATRGEVRDTIDGLAWNGGQWADAITRGQLARLIWRAR